MKVVICGAGIIGAATAYYLALKGVKVTLLEREYPACAASGKAGGFLAYDWCIGQAVEHLARKSFELHMELSEDARFSGCDYRKLDALSLAVREGRSRSTEKTLPTWLDGPVTRSSAIGFQETTAQVHPLKLTNAFIKVAKELVGSEVLVTTVEKVVTEGGKVTGVMADGSLIPADVVVIAMGPWSAPFAKEFNLQPILSRRAHSIVLKPTSDITPHALFVDYKDKSGRDHSPEMYPRPDGTIYICGEIDDVPLPASAAQVVPDSNSCQKLQEMAANVSSSLATGSEQCRQVCYLPHTKEYKPMIGPIPEAEGAFMACGHNCWGILNAPATGAALAELITDGKAQVVNLAPFTPS